MIEKHMPKNVFLSIIIPVYNVEPYLEKCLSSVLACDLSSCEIILSLGESADRSNDICLNYKRKYSFIQSLYQDGTGLSNARNCGMSAAEGEYLLFLDSDDYVDSLCLNTLIAQLRERTLSADIIVTDFYRMDRRTGHFTSIFQIGEDMPVQYGMDFLPQMLRKRQCFWNVWRYLYRRSFLEQHGIRFIENRLSEDIDFTTNVFLTEPETVFSHSPYYVYTVGRGESLMDRPNFKRLSDTVFVLQNVIERLRNSNFRYAPQLIAQYQFEYVLNLALTIEIDPADREAALALYTDWRQMLSGSTDPVVRGISYVIKAVGLKLTGYVLHILKRLRRFFRNHTPKEKKRDDNYQNALPHQLRWRRQ